VIVVHAIGSVLSAPRIDRADATWQSQRCWMGGVVKTASICSAFTESKCEHSYKLHVRLAEDLQRAVDAIAAAAWSLGCSLQLSCVWVFVDWHVAWHSWHDWLIEQWRTLNARVCIEAPKLVCEGLFVEGS
jgi:hypothetical protein